MQSKLYHNKTGVFFQVAVFFAALFLVFGFLGQGAEASLIDDLKKEITERANEIRDLENQAKEYEGKLSQTVQQKNTLKNQVNALENEVYNLNINIKKTQVEIVEASLTIDLLNEEIGLKTEDISDLKEQMAHIIQLIYEKDKTNLVFIVLSAKNFSEALSERTYLGNLEKDVSASLIRIKSLKNLLQVNKGDQEEKRETLYSLNSKLADQQSITNGKKKEKDSLLATTKNKESEYQKVLSNLSKQRQNIEKEIGGLEKKLKTAIDLSKLPKGKGIIKWPVENIRITQGYGMTSYAKSGAYNGNEHNGIDLGGATGTEVFSAASGEVIGSGNNGRYAYGKWISIKHDNGLITLYAHLSLQKVKKGQRVAEGQLIGYIGATGYVTGPHLHFTVYAPDSFDLYQSTRVSWLWIPIGAPLNPYDYL